MINRPARRSCCGLAGVGRAGRLNQQHMNLFPRNGAMLDAPGHDVHLPRPERDRSIAKLDIQHAIQDQEEIIGIVGLVPDKFTLHFHAHNVAIVELRHRAR